MLHGGSGHGLLVGMAPDLIGDHTMKKQEVWEEEILANHRWGRLPSWFNTHKSAAKKEHVRLKKLWKRAQPLDVQSHQIIEQIIGLEICNWRLEESIITLCKAIGSNKPTKVGIGHMASITTKRWMRIWSYYLACRKWVSGDIRTGYTSLLKLCDPDKKTENHIFEMLDRKTVLKKLYVRRFLLCLEYWLDGCVEGTSPKRTTEEKEVEKEIKRRTKNEEILKAFHLEGVGKLEFCHHKLFRRYDIILSSIGSLKWRAKLGRRKIDGFVRADTMEKYIAPIESWIGSRGKMKKNERSSVKKKIFSLLGKPDSVKLFLSSLLVSLLRSQQIAALKLADERTKT